MPRATQPPRRRSCIRERRGHEPSLNEVGARASASSAARSIPSTPDTSRPPLAARDALALDRVLVLPSRLPPHRPHQPSASAFHRFAMAALAVNGLDGLEASDVGARRSGAVLHRATRWTGSTRSGAASVADFLHHRRRRVRRNRHLAPLSRRCSTWRTSSSSRGRVRRRPRSPSALPALRERITARPHDAVAACQHPDLRPAGSDTGRLVDRRFADGCARANRSPGSCPISVEPHILQHRSILDDSSSGLIHSAADHLHGQN